MVTVALTNDILLTCP